ncbi:MucBP domain-containing protein [Mediterraneibacter glycyrrhizinilyticus]|uniref:MucBP domain-containing protein n=1 Tax=Mediterraneibacter glycyrrhizinilyticus TaxID=342942 RepID=UPI00265845F9|nr:MucBP domain-containing protein [Mediterraneibacter glycyrrhizinilyticus]MCF2569042.1 MucBP domain-containing protein [Mediterraneibacter glycyrrhizinilyticus]
MKSVKTWKKLLSVVLSSAIIVTTLAPGAVASAAENPSVQQGAEVLDFDGTSTDISSADQTENSSKNAPAEQNADDAVTPDEESNTQDTTGTAEDAGGSTPVQKQQPESAAEENKAQTKAAADTDLYQDGSICIYNEQQLRAIGNGAQVYEGDASADTFGTGAALTKEDGSALTYAADGTYTLMNDIPLTKGSAWTLPEGFAGAFNDAEVTEDAPLYDAETDTIYVYHQYQLATINDPEALKTVMSKDMIAKDFGVGQIVYEDADQTVQLEYTDAHNYVVSKDFTEEMPELTATEVQDVSTVQLGDRAHVGQVYTTIKNEKYILIGNEQQLREIGTNHQVSPMLFLRTEIKILGIPMGSSLIPYYPGDADFNLTNVDETGIKYSDIDAKTKAFQYMDQDSKPENLLNPDFGDDSDLLGEVVGIVESVLQGVIELVAGEREIVGLKDEGTSNVSIGADDGLLSPREYKSFSELKEEYKNLKYSSNANYIIFRDIDLASGEFSNGSDDDWNPIMFSGNMLGRKNMQEGSPINISNVKVNQDDPISATQNIGVGFFGTISEQRTSDLVSSAGITLVKDINLSNVDVRNEAKTLHVDESLLSGLVAGVGKVVGSILDIVIDGLGFLIPGLKDLKLGDTVEKLLTLNSDDKDTYATGSFAGRVIGNVKLENCHVTQGYVENVKDITGGFVGYAEGTEQYEAISGGAGATVKFLSSLLNVIPGLGLGDVISLLLEKDIPLGRLIPIGYYKPQIMKCSVELSSKDDSTADAGASIGSTSTSYNGGFIGIQRGTVITCSSVSNLSSVNAANYAGGFAGLESDDMLEGVLSPITDTTYATPNVQSEQVNCSVNGIDGLAVSASESYAGGFNGCMANSKSTNCVVANLEEIFAAKSYAGGFAGRSTIGYAITLGDRDELDNTLLGAIISLAAGVATGDYTPNQQLLHLAGITVSEIHGCTVRGSGITIEAEESYAGGLIGSGDGTIIETSKVCADDNVVNADSMPVIELVSASKGYAGGIAGALTTANGAGLLGETVGLVQVQEYEATDLSTSVRQVKAEKGDYAGGAFGLLTGGEVDQVSVGAIETVTANNYAGGFAGRSGVGSLVDAKGLDILGLGAVEVGNLVSIGNLTSVDIKNSTVTGKDLTVSATGNTEGNDYFAGGFVSENNSGKIEASSVTGLQRVFTKTTGYFWGDEDKLTASYAGGFAARSQVGGLANVGADGDTVGGLLGENGVLEINDLINAVGYLIPSYTNCFVEFTDRNSTEAQVSAAVAGGFIGEMQGGTVDNRGLNAENKEYAVRNAEYITGTYYAGGFAGKILSGGLAQSNGLSLLGKHIDVGGLLKLIPTYIPTVYSAGVQSSEDGLKVYASESDSKDVDSGSAGGYAGLTSGARISNSIVKDLATKSEATDAAPKENDYAVKAPRFAGGYVGKAEIGSAAAVGQSLDVLRAIEIGSLTSAIAAVESKFEGCDVYGKAGGFNVNSTEGSAGGYAGVVEGSNFNDSDSYNFEYIKGDTSAGGYAGTIQPGDVASLAESAEILKGLLEVENLLQVAQTFIARIWNSETTAVPCGGYVIATGTSDGANLKGLAGGYAGYNLGGQIKGEYTGEAEGATEGEAGKSKLPIFENNKFETKTAAAIRIRSVEGEEFAGGFTGLMEAANVAETGNLKLLWGLVTADNLLQAVSAVYPTEENTKVTGPLDSMSLGVWNGWVDAVGSSGAYGDIFKENKNFETEKALNEFLADYVYGYTVKANAKGDTMTGVDAGGSAGGYVGRMEGGVITNGYAQDLKSVKAYRSAGGFAGEMVTGTIADLGGLSIGDLKVADGVGIVKTFVPVIYTSRVDGYNSGFTVEATAAADNTSIGNAGGFVGYADGAQIFDSKDGKNEAADPNAKAKAAAVTNLRTVTGHKNVGGFAGIMQAGAALGADVTSSSGLLNQILSHLISQDQVSNLVNVLQATRTVVDSAEVTGYMPANEGDSAKPVFSVVGDKGEKADFAGGFAGKLTGALIGDESSETKDSVVIKGLKSVAGGKHVGGFFGLADVDGLVEVAEDSETSILDLIGLGNVDVLNAFRTYIYSATVNGAENSGLSIYAKESTDSGNVGVIDRVVSFFTGDEAVDQTDKDGNAGGFGGSLKDSSVVNCEVNNLNRVNALTYAGGFIGFTGKSGVVDVDNVDVLDKLLGASAGVADIFGSQVKDSNVNGSDKTGYIIRSKDGEECIAGGFIGYGDLARVDNCHAQKLKQVYSDQIAGGFIGKTSFAYLAEVDAGSNVLLNPILSVVNQLLKYLYADELQDIGLIQVTLPEPFDKVLNLEVLNDNNVLSVTLLGLTISVGLVKGDETTSDVAQIHIGDSYIEVKCHNDPNGKNYIDNDSNISIGLIKANRTRVGDSSVSGISIGYDVFGGGAGNEKDGTDKEGYAGGFVGFNDEGLFETNQMYYADTIRGTKGLVGEFSGQTSLETVYEGINNLDAIEGTDNIYRVYRKDDGKNLTQVYSNNGKLLNDPATEDPSSAKAFERETIDDTSYYVYGIEHRKDGIKESSASSLHKAVWASAYQKAKDKNAEFSIYVYVSDAQADLMLGTPTYAENEDPDYADEEMQDPCDEEIRLTVQKIWIDDEGNPVEKPDQVVFEVHQNGEPYTPAGANKPLKIVLTPENAEADPNSWVTTVSVPFKAPDGKEYSYSVKETGAAGNDDYVTIYPAAEEDGHLICVINFQVSELVQEDSVVIDYGLPVDIDVLANDRVDEYGIDGSLTSVKNKNGDTSSDENSTVSGRYGKARVETKSEGTKVIEYKPTSMSMDSFDEFSYSVQLDEQVTGNDNTVVEGSLSIIPATEIYYEDNFDAIQYTNGNAGTVPAEDEISEGAEDKYANSGVWEEVKVESYSEGRHQEEDRPGTEDLKDALDNIYGNDTSYTDDKEYSGGSSHKVKVSLANLAANGGTSPKASFTFTGTGFDVISVTDGCTGAVRVTVKDAETKKTVTSKSVNTYYGYTYSEGGGWQVQEDPTGALYQIPVIKIEGLEQKTYDVEIVPTYIAMFDQKDRGYYNFYLDAVRVYDPADPDSKGNEIIKEAYQADGEYDSYFAELRNLLINAGELTEEADAAPGVVFVDGNKEEADFSDYVSHGPNNELYLMHNQAIAFYLEADNKPETIQLSAKLAMGQEADMAIAFAAEQENEWVEYNSETITVTSAYDMHYDISEQCMWIGDEEQGYRTKYPIVIRNASKAPADGSDTGAVLSLTNLNWSVAVMPIAEPLETSLQIVADRNAALAAYSLVEVKPDQSITVQYLDTEGNILADAAVQSVQQGSQYNVADLTEKSIEGYTIQEIRGDAVQGTADTDKVIQVIYTVQECSIVVAYVDRNGNTIADPYVETVSYGNSYDVKRETIKKIWGYRQAETAGDEIKGVAKGDVNITVIYDKEKNIVTEIVHTVIDTVGNWLSSIFGR